MTDPIGRGDYVLGTDVSGVEKGVATAEAEIKRSATEIERQYTDTGRQAGERFSGAMSKGLKIVGTAAAAGFAIAAKGTLELQSATASFRAETGATAAEAEKAGRAINAMSGRNIQGVEEIGSALAKVHNSLGLTGDGPRRVLEAMDE